MQIKSCGLLAILLLCIAGIARAQKSVQVTGVISSMEHPLSGASVSVKDNSKNGTVAGVDGRYTITVPENATLVFSSVGYTSKEEKVNGRTTIDVLLVEAGQQLNDVVVVGYGTQKKENLTGSVASIQPKELRSRPVTSVQNALQGVSPGLTILNRPGSVSKASNGSSNGDGTITVRGRTNLGSPGPMIVIDGIPASNAELSALNPNDIASMSVLKDAASAAIYGSRAANGVILITTRKGKGEKLSVEFNFDYGLQSPTRMPEYVNSVQYATLYNEAMTNAGAKPVYSDDVIEKFRSGSEPDLYPNTDWLDLFFRKNPPMTSGNVNVSSTGKYTDYYLGVSYLNQQSLYPGQSQNRASVKLNTNTNVIKDILKFGTNLSFIKQDYDNNGGDISLIDLYRSLPITVARQSNGAWGSVTAGAENATNANINQLRLLDEGGSNYNKDNYLQLAANAELTPFKGFSVNGLMSLKYTNENSWDFNKTMEPIVGFISGNPMNSTARTTNEMKEYWGKRQEFLVQGYANYEMHLDRHYIKVMAGASQESNIYRTAFLGRKNFPNNDVTTIITGSTGDANMSSDGDGQANRTMNTEWAMRSFFGRINYNFAEKYLFEANLRSDYSSRFISDLRGHVFPSLSAAWKISDENFMKNISWLNNLKIRGSWGQLGNQDAVPIGNYYSLINFGYAYSFGGSAYDGAWQSAGANPMATWETVTMTNIGIDATFMDRHVNLTADYYIKDADGILMQPPTLDSYGLSEIPYANAASTRNKGIEVALNYNGKIGDFSFNLGGNISAIQNEILSLGGEQERFNGNYIEKVGEKVGAFYGYVVDGLFTSEEEVASSPFQSSNTHAGDIKYKDLDGNKVIDDNDRAVIGNDVPWLNYGFTLNATYKNFDLSVLTYGVANVDAYLSNEASQPFFNGAGVKVQYLDHRWTKENPDANADFPRLLTSADGNQNYGRTSSFWLFDAGYFRVRSITLGYNLPSDLIKKASMTQARVYIAASNPFTFMADKRLGDWDPEMASGRGGYPGIKTWSIGLNIKF